MKRGMGVRKGRLLVGAVAASSCLFLAGSRLVFQTGLRSVGPLGLQGRELSSYFTAAVLPRNLSLLNRVFPPPLRGRLPQEAFSVERPEAVPVPAVNCAALLERAQHQPDGLDGFRDPNAGLEPSHYQRRATNRDDVPFWISLHRQDYDPMHWSIFEDGRHPQQQLEAIWRRILSNSPDGSHVVEVGGSVGYFALATLSLGRSFVFHAFEPNPLHALRVCESLALNGWTAKKAPSSSDRRPDDDDAPGLHWHPVGVADSNEVLPFAVPQRRRPIAAAFYRSDSPSLSHTPHTNASVVSLDSWAERRHLFESPQPHVAILRIEFGVPEHRVLRGASRLLQSRAVRNVLLAVSAASESQERRARTALEVLASSGYRLSGFGGALGPGTHARVLLRPGDGSTTVVDAILSEARKHKGRPLSLWWTVAD